MKKSIINLLPLISIVVVLLIWALCSYIIDSEYILPSVLETTKEFVKLFQRGEFYLSLGFTLLRSVIAFSISFILAFLIAYFSYKSVVVKKLFSPIIAILRALPTVAIVLILLFWTTSKIAPIIVTMLVILPTLYTEIYNSINSLDKLQIEMARLDRANEFKVLFKIIIPEILPMLLIFIGSGLSLNIKLMVASEVLSSTANSIGIMLQISKVNFEIANMIALVLISVIICVLIELFFKALSKKKGSWK